LISARATTLTAPWRDPDFVWRVRMWKEAWQLTRERPLFGWGIGTFPLEQSRAVPGSLPRKLLQRIGPTLSQEAHDEYLQIAAEMGILGLALYLWALGAFFLSGLRALPRREHGFRKLVLMGCLAAVVGQAVDALSNPAWRFADVSFLLWLNLGLGIASTRPSRHSPPEETRGAVSTAAGLIRIGWQAAALCLTVMTMAGVWERLDRHCCPLPMLAERATVRLHASGPVRAGFLYGVTGASHTRHGGGILLSIDSNTADAMLIGAVRNIETGQDVGDIEDVVDIGNNTLLAAGYPGAGRAGAFELYSIDPRTAAATPIGRIRQGSTEYWVEGLAWANGVLYGSAATYDLRTGGSDSYCSDCSNHLIKISFDLMKHHVQARDLGRFGPQFQNLEDLAAAPQYGLVGADIGTLDPSTGFHTFHTMPALIRIDPNAVHKDELATKLCDLPPPAAKVSLVPNPDNHILSPYGPFLAGLDFSPNGTLYASTQPTQFGGESHLITVNLPHGALVDLGTIAGPDLAGLEQVDGIAFPAAHP
jgi:hypothetical protein